jgi:hypothetical protein
VYENRVLKKIFGCKNVEVTGMEAGRAEFILFTKYYWGD